MLHRNVIEYEKPVVLSFQRRWHEYEDVYSFEFAPSEKLPFRAGQNARIVIPTLPEEVAAHSLSFASPPGAEHILFSMHTGSRSPFKRAMLELKAGDTVHLVKIKGETFLPEDASRPVVLIAGGIGITPFRSILRYIAVSQRSTESVLVHVSRGAYLYEAELSKMKCEQHRIRRPDIKKTLTAVAEKHADALYYIAGPPPFLDTVKKILQDLEISELRIRASRFTGYEHSME